MPTSRRHPNASWPSSVANCGAGCAHSSCDTALHSLRQSTHCWSVAFQTTRRSAIGAMSARQCYVGITSASIPIRRACRTSSSTASHLSVSRSCTPSASSRHCWRPNLPRKANVLPSRLESRYQLQRGGTSAAQGRSSRHQPAARSCCDWRETAYSSTKTAGSSSE
jgi:hypothetical protein